MPTSGNACVYGSSTQEEFYSQWEKGRRGCTFPTGVNFSWNIEELAQLQVNYSKVGTCLHHTMCHVPNISLLTEFLVPRTGTDDFKAFTAYKDDHS